MPTIQQYRSMLVLNKHRLDDELEAQADVQERISREVVLLNSAMLAAKDKLARVEGRLGEELREDEPKLTVELRAAKVARDPARIASWEAYQSARAQHEEWSNLLEAWRQRGYSIKTLADLYGSQYFSLRSAVARSPQERRSESRGDRNAQRALDSIKEAAPTDTPVRSRRRTGD
jgi:hypothetical protein